MKVFFFSLLMILAGIILLGCSDNGDYTLVPKEVQEEKIEDIIPPSLLSDLEKEMVIYRGNTPPNVENSYLCSPCVLISSNFDDDKLLEKYADMYICFMNQSKLNTLAYKSIQSNAYGYADDVSIAGSDNTFTAYFTETTTSEKDNYTCKTATVISGEMTSLGIKNYTYAFLMIEKTDPNELLVPVNTIRVFKDDDGLAEKTQWPSSRSSFISNNNAIGKLTKEK